MGGGTLPRRGKMDGKRMRVSNTEHSYSLVYSVFFVALPVVLGVDGGLVTPGRESKVVSLPNRYSLSRGFFCRNIFFFLAKKDCCKKERESE